MCMERRRFSQTMASEWQTAFVVSRKIPWCALLTAVKNYNKSWKTARLFLQDRDQDQDHSRPRLHDPRPRPRLSFFCPRGASRPRPWSRGLHCRQSLTYIAPKCWGVHRVARCTIAYIITSVCCCTMSILSVNKKKENWTAFTASCGLVCEINMFMRCLWDQIFYRGDTVNVHFLLNWLFLKLISLILHILAIPIINSYYNFFIITFILLGLPLYILSSLFIS